MIQVESWNSITVCGMKGTGKTTLIKKGLLPKYKELFVFDPNGEYSEFPSYQPESDSPMELERIAKVIWDRWNCLLVVSEAELYLPVNQNLPPSIFKIVARGRHRNIGLIADTRRIANLNKTVFGLSEHCFVFRHFSPTDTNYLNQFLTEDARKLANLQNYWYWHYTRGTVEVCSPLPV